MCPREFGTYLSYSNKKETSDFYDTVYFDPVKLSQQKYNQNVSQTGNDLIFVFLSERVNEPNVKTAFPLSSGSQSSKRDILYV